MTIRFNGILSVNTGEINTVLFIQLSVFSEYERIFVPLTVFFHPVGFQG